MSDSEMADKRVLGVFAHPDDPEVYAGGTFARWAAEGAGITFVMATSGDKGSADPQMTAERLVAMREEEERRAAAVLGVREVIFLRFRDCELAPTLELRREIVRAIRRYRPDIVVTGDPLNWYNGQRINHPDHRAIGEATLAAVFPTARDRLNFPEMERDEGLAPHKVHQVFICGAANPNMHVDVSDYVDTQIRALAEHKSQMSMEGLGQRMRERRRDPHAPADAPRLIESFFVVTFAR